MTERLILASGSPIRAQMLRNANLEFEVDPARVDEPALRAALEEEDAAPRDVADALAEMKAVRVSRKRPGCLVLGCDQVLDRDGAVMAKPESPEAARDQLVRLRGRTHRLLSAAVICQDGAPLWRHVGQARLTMRSFSDAYLDAYLARNWESVRHSVGGYKIEEEGVRLFSHISGDHFTILGLPLLEVLSYLAARGTVPG